MKKLCFFIFLLISCLLLSGCRKTPNMTALLDYQKDNWTMQLRIKDAEDIYLVKAQKTQEGIIFFFQEDERKNVGYLMDREENIFIVFQDLKIPMENTEALPCREWFACFDLSVSESIWRIKKESPGGVGVFVCRDGYFTVYIDCKTNLPLKIQTKKTEIDVISVDKG